MITLFCELATVKSLSLSATAPVRVTAPVPAVMVRSSFPPLLKVSVDPTSPPPAPVPTAVALPLSPVTAPLKSIAPPTVVTSAPKLAASRVIVPVPLIARSPLMSVAPLSVISRAPVLPLIPAVITLFCELATVKSLSLSATARSG